VRKDQEVADQRMKSVDSPSWRARLEAVKAQMEDSTLKVELAEQEMRRAVQSMRDEQRPSTTGGAPDRRSRSVADMQELIHGLREEQQQAKQALHACQQGMRKARGAIMIMLWNGNERSRLERLFQRWVSAALKVIAAGFCAERDQLAEHMRKERRQMELLESQLRAGGYELEERSLRSESLVARVGELQQILAKRTEAMALEVEATRDRTLKEMRMEHQLQLEELRTEHEAATRRTWRRAQRAQQAAAMLVPRAQYRRLVGQCFGAFKMWVSQERAVRQMRERFEQEERAVQEDRAALTERLLAAEATASAALTAASVGQQAADAAKATADRQIERLLEEVEQLRSRDASRPELLQSLESSTSEIERLSSLIREYKASHEQLSAQLEEQRTLVASSVAHTAAAVAQREAALAVALGQASGHAATSELVLEEQHAGMVAAATLSAELASIEITAEIAARALSFALPYAMLSGQPEMGSPAASSFATTARDELRERVVWAAAASPGLPPRLNLGRGEGQPLSSALSLRSTVPASADAPARLLESATALSTALAADTADTERRALALEVSLHAAEVRQQQTEARLHAAEVRQQQTEARLLRAEARVHESEEREARERAEANVLRLELGVFESALRRTEQALMQAQHSVASHEAALTQLAETSAHAHAQERARAMAAREALVAQTQAQLTEQRVAYERAFASMREGMREGASAASQQVARVISSAEEARVRERKQLDEQRVAYERAMASMNEGMRAGAAISRHQVTLAQTEAEAANALALEAMARAESRAQSSYAAAAAAAAVVAEQRDVFDAASPVRAPASPADTARLRSEADAVAGRMAALQKLELQASLSERDREHTEQLVLLEAEAAAALQAQQARLASVMEAHASEVAELHSQLAEHRGIASESLRVVHEMEVRFAFTEQGLAAADQLRLRELEAAIQIA